MFVYILILCFGVVYFINLGYNAIWLPNEAFTADGVRYIFEEGKIIIPYFNGEPFLHKPPMPQWLSALGSLLFGLNEFGIRIPFALMGIGMGFLTYLLAKEFTDKKTATLSALIMISSFQFLGNARYATPEIPFSFFILLTVYLWTVGYKRKKNIYILLSSLPASLAVLTKWPPGFIIPASVIFLYLLLKDRKELLNPSYYIGTIFVVLLSGWWFLYLYINERERFLNMFYFENIQRIYGIQEDPIYFHLINIPVSFLPFSIMLYAAVMWWIKNKRKNMDLFGIWFLLMLFVFSLVKMKLPTYMMPAYPAMSILTAEFITKSDWRKTKLIISLFLFCLLIIAIPVLGQMTEFNIPVIAILFIMTVIFIFLSKNSTLLPAIGGFAFSFYLIYVGLNYIENFRHHKEVGLLIKEKDPERKFHVHQVGNWFFESIPFYSGRVNKPYSKPEDIKRPSFVLTPYDKYKYIDNCKIIWRKKMITVSEAQFFKFLTSIKSGDNMREYVLCLAE